MRFRRGRRATNAAVSEDGSAADERPVEPDPQLAAVTSLSAGLARARDEDSIARTLLEECVELLGVNFAGVAVVTEDGATAVGLVALEDGSEPDWWREVSIDFENEPSGIASAAFEAAPVVVYDVAASTEVNRRLAERVGAKSAAFVPLVSDDRVPAVLVVATTKQPRVFTGEEIALLQALAAETAMALERVRSADALGEALEREQLVASIGRKVRSELDLEDVLRVAVEETGKGAGVSRCFIRLGEPGGPMPIRAEWDDEGFVPIGTSSERLVVSNLAARDRRTVASGDIRSDPELEDPSLGGIQTLLDLGTLAVLATPVLVFDRMIGVFGFHRPEPTTWTEADVSLAEAVAREVGIAIHAARLLAENSRRLDQQTALLKAAQVVTSELRLETVLQRLVVEVTNLLGADAADCYLFDSDRSVLRCAAVYGLDAGLLELEFPAGRDISGRFEPPVPHPAYEGFAAAVTAPMTWSGESRGVLGVTTRDPAKRFGPRESELLETFADLASLAVRNAASFGQSVRQARVQRGFYAIASALAEPLSQSATLDAVAAAATEALGGSFAAVLMPGAQALELAASHGLPQTLALALGDGVPESAGVITGCARDRRLLSASSLPDDDRFGEDWRRVTVEGGARALLAIPLDPPRREEGGAVVLFFAEERTFSADDLELARRLAGAARGALERSELYESERTSRALSQQLARMGGLLATELDPALILDEVTKQAAALLGADACSIQVVEGEELVMTAAEGPGLEPLLGTRSLSTARPAGDVVQSRSPVSFTDAAGDPRMVADDPVLAAGYAAYLGVPLLGAEGGFQGALAVYGLTPRAWRDEEVQALSALAGNASAALSNAELYQRMALERERSLAILANIADGIVAVDRDGRVVLWNRTAEQITGVPAAAASGRTPVEVIQRELASEGEEPIRQRLLSIRRGGDEVWLSLTEAVMRDPAGAVAGRIFAFRDISAERIVEEMKSGFVSTVSHELRAPLTSIYGFAETLLRQDILFDEVERRMFLGYIASEAQRLTGIVDTLLSVARLEAGDLQVDLEPIDVRSIVSEVLTNVRQSAEVNGQHFVLDFPDEPLAASADREKLRQILANLIDNAVKFSPTGGTVTVEARRRSGNIEVRVVDEGSGIPETERERIFTKFHRRGNAPGAGLGLFIARGLVAAMGGRIWVDSAEGGGSSFAFELPLAAGPAVEGD